MIKPVEDFRTKGDENRDRGEWERRIERAVNMLIEEHNDVVELLKNNVLYEHPLWTYTQDPNGA